MRPRVFFYVQHLLGVGHLYRAFRIAHGLREGGFEVLLVLGGIPVEGLDQTGLEVVQLAPLKAGTGGFSELVTPDGAAAGPAFKEARRRELLAAFERASPDVLLIEAFPFGRRQMRFELLPLLDAARARRPRPLIVSSIRDILQESAKPGRAEETVALLRTCFDHVIVHGDPRLVALGETFPLAGEIAAMTSYTGMVAPPAPPARLAAAGTVSAPEVVVSAGGGAVGRELIRAAMAAKPLSRLSSARWLVVTGPNIADRELEALGHAGSLVDVAVERFVPDLARVLADAHLSISQAGYNTVADILVARCRAVLVPFAAGGETEQTRRATLLEQRGLCVVVPEAALSARSLADAADRAMALPPPGLEVDLGGAAGTAAILRELLRR
jgi:predicted glycosyltransferase